VCSNVSGFVLTIWCTLEDDKIENLLLWWLKNVDVIGSIEVV
jgi:hypothetical protein